MAKIKPSSAKLQSESFNWILQENIRILDIPWEGRGLHPEKWVAWGGCKAVGGSPKIPLLRRVQVARELEYSVLDKAGTDEPETRN